VKSVQYNGGSAVRSALDMPFIASVIAGLRRKSVGRGRTLSPTNAFWLHGGYLTFVSVVDRSAHCVAKQELDI
jgi:hypothetical protein